MIGVFEIGTETIAGDRIASVPIASSDTNSSITESIVNLKVSGPAETATASSETAASAVTLSSSDTTTLVTETFLFTFPIGPQADVGGAAVETSSIAASVASADSGVGTDSHSWAPGGRGKGSIVSFSFATGSIVSI